MISPIQSILKAHGLANKFFAITTKTYELDMFNRGIGISLALSYQIRRPSVRIQLHVLGLSICTCSKLYAKKNILY